MKISSKLTEILNLFDKNEHLAVLLIFVIAVLTRCIFLNAHGFSNFKAGDTIGYISLSKDLLAGKPLSTYKAFGFVVYLSVISKLTGQIDLNTLRVLNILIGSLTVVVMYFVGKYLYNKTTGYCAAGITAFHLNLLYWTGFILTEVPFLLFLSLVVFYLMKFSRSKGYRDLLMAGIVFMITCSIRGIALVLIVPIVFWIIFILNKNKGSRLILVSLLSMFLISLPVLITDQFISPQKGTVAWAEGTVKGEVLRGLLWDEKGRATTGVDIKPENLPLKIAQYDKDPFRYSQLMIEKLKAFWWIYTPEMSINHKMINCLYLVPLYILAIIGLFFSGENWERSSLIFLFIIFFTLACMVGIVDYDGRYHLPVELLTNILSAYGICVVMERKWKNNENSLNR